jgi:tetratricopeptide (TPR) repeat protein
VLASGVVSGAALCLAQKRPVRLAAGAAVFAVAWLLCGADLEDDPLHIGQSHEQLAALLLSAGRPEEAAVESAAAIETLEGAWVRLGGKLAEDGHGLDLTAAAERPAVSPSFLEIVAEAYATHAAALRRQKRVEEAGVWERRARMASTRSSPGIPPAASDLMRQGQRLAAGGQFREAAAVFRKARQEVPAASPMTRLWVALHLAQALHRGGESQEALAVLKGAVEEGGDAIPPSERAAAHYGWALIYRDLGEEESMRSHMRECLRLDPAHPRAAWMQEMLAEPER